MFVIAVDSNIQVACPQSPCFPPPLLNPGSTGLLCFRGFHLPVFVGWVLFDPCGVPLNIFRFHLGSSLRSPAATPCGTGTSEGAGKGVAWPEMDRCFSGKRGMRCGESKEKLLILLTTYFLKQQTDAQRRLFHNRFIFESRYEA